LTQILCKLVLIFTLQPTGKCEVADTLNLKIGDSVVVKFGVKDPDLSLAIEGWQGRIVEIEKKDSSVGIAWDSITAENIVQEQFSRNPKIVKVLYHWNYIDELGIGVDRMIRAMTGAGHPPPEFTANGHTVMLQQGILIRKKSGRATVYKLAIQNGV
jgi:Putative ATP-dependent DNA helicase recG C-terminal